MKNPDQSGMSFSPGKLSWSVTTHCREAWAKYGAPDPVGLMVIVETGTGLRVFVMTGIFETVTTGAGAWLSPQSTIQPRFLKLSATIDF